MSKTPTNCLATARGSVPLRVACAYAVFATLWIVSSDLLLGRFARESDTMVGAAMLKGMLFVLTTSVLLYLAVRRYTDALHRSQEELHEREEMYRAVFEASNDGLCIEELDGTIVKANPAFCRMHGYAADELGGMKIAELAHPDHRHLLERTEEQLDRPGGHQRRLLNLRKDGTALAVEAHSNRLVHGGRLCALSVFRDITDRLQAENELRESRRFLRAALDAMLTHVAILDEQGRILTVNEAWRRYAEETACPFHRCAVGADYVLACQNAGVPPTDNGPVIAQGIRDILARRRDTFTREYECTCGGANRCFDVRVSRFEEPGPTRVVVAHVDITDRKRVEEALRLSEQRFRTLFEHAPEAILVIDADSREIIDANENFLRLSRRTREQLLAASPEDLHPLFQPDGRPSQEAIIDYDNQALAGNVPVFEWVHRNGDGQDIPCEVRLVRLPAAGRNLLRASITDISARKKAEEALRLSEQRFRTLFEHAPEAVAVLDVDSRRVVDANENALRLFKATREQLLTLGPMDLSPAVQPDGRPSLEAIAEYNQQVLAGGEPVFEWLHRNLAGEEFPCEVRLVLLPAANRSLVRASVTDISERKHAQQALARQTEELARSNAELERFAYVASHDLQEPLRMVSSYTQLLARRYRGRLDADADEFIAYVVDGVTQMQTLISDLLAYSRVASQGRPPVVTSVTSAIERALANLQFAVQESAAIVTQGPLPEVLADQVQLVQLFQNLLSNAIKFRRHERPRVHVAARRQGREWVFSVTDNGIGIEAEYLDRVFVMFQRLHTRAEHPGTGMGLTICKRIVERHGGRIWVESEPGKGSTFFFTLPAVPDEPA